MSANGTNRIQKPTPERVDPFRNFGTLLGRTPSSAKGSARERATESQVERGVRAGYEVIAEYLNEGRSSARSFADAEADAPAPASLEQLTERLFQHASDLGSVWMDLLRTFNRRQSDASASEPPGGFSTNGGGMASGTGNRSSAEVAQPNRSGAEVPVTVSVASPLPVRVDVRLHGSPPAVGGVAAHGPRRAGDDRVLRGVTIGWQPDENRLSACLSLEAEVEPGTYTGVLVARETNIPFGTLCVVVQSQLEVPGADHPR
jgi:hypothetical protein